jgi:tRNA(fMet)-specific endonuclease VapC
MLDTNTASYIIRGTGGALAARLRAVPAAQLCVSAITEGELLFGVARRIQAGHLGANNLQLVVREFLTRVETLDWDRAAAARYAGLRAALEADGTPLGNLDTLIAAHALAADAVLVTNDRSFARVPGLTVENWVVTSLASLQT